MHFLSRILLIIAVAAGLAACGSNPIKQFEGKTAYTQIGLWSDGGRHLTTNYGRRIFIPINTQVKILDTNSEAIVFQTVDDSQRVQLVNVEGYTRKNIKEIYDRYFGPSKVSLNQFGKQERQAIQSGKVEAGMSKQAVLLARGYPPAHQTPSIDNNTWTYWESRFDTIEVRFESGKVASIKD